MRKQSCRNLILRCKRYQPLLSLYGPGRASLPPSRPPLPPLIGPPLRSSRRPPPLPRDFPVDCSTLIVAPLKLELWSALIAAAASSSRAMWTKPYRFITSHSVTSPKRKNNCRNSSLRQFSGSRPTNIFVFLCETRNHMQHALLLRQVLGIEEIISANESLQIKLDYKTVI